MKSIIVTGAAGGIGRAVVGRLAKEGFSVLACDRDSAGLEKAVQAIQAEYPKSKVESAVFDVTDTAAVLRFGESLGKRAPDLCGLVNNAGIYLGRDLFQYKLEEMERVMAVNLFSAVQLSQIVGKILVGEKRKGVIINMSSISAFEGSSDALYGVTKSGLIGLTRSCAITFAPFVRVNAVAPGIVDTPLIEAIPKWRIEEFEKSERLKGRISPEAVASAVWFLVSDESRHTTGSVIDLNNGGYFR